MCFQEGTSDAKTEPQTRETRAWPRTRGRAAGRTSAWRQWVSRRCQAPWIGQQSTVCPIFDVQLPKTQSPCGKSRNNFENDSFQKTKNFPSKNKNTLRSYGARDAGAGESDARKDYLFLRGRSVSSFHWNRIWWQQRDSARKPKPALRPRTLLTDCGCVRRPSMPRPGSCGAMARMCVTVCCWPPSPGSCRLDDAREREGRLLTPAWLPPSSQALNTKP
jgi:hypothetical protein